MSFSGKLEYDFFFFFVKLSDSVLSPVLVSIWVPVSPAYVLGPAHSDLTSNQSGPCIVPEHPLPSSILVSACLFSAENAA